MAQDLLQIRLRRAQVDTDNLEENRVSVKTPGRIFKSLYLRIRMIFSYIES